MINDTGQPMNVANRLLSFLKSMTSGSISVSTPVNNTYDLIKNITCMKYALTIYYWTIQISSKCSGKTIQYEYNKYIEICD